MTESRGNVLIPADVMDEFANLLTSDFVQVAGHATCTEADIIGKFLFVAGREDAAAHWLIGHAGGDDDPDDKHRDIVGDWDSTGLGTDEHIANALAYLRGKFGPHTTD